MSEGTSLSGGKAQSWLREEFERARRRNALIPRHARAVVRLHREPERTGCHCGHPGSGCICYSPGQAQS